VRELKTIAIATVPVVLGVILAGYLMAQLRGSVELIATAHSGYDS
jgi:hypothetical protein